MKVLEDCFGNKIRLTPERLMHILEHPEMRGMEDEIETALLVPQFVRRSRSDASVKLYYAYYKATIVGGKWLCIVVRFNASDAFVVTAYLTNQLKVGENLWPKN